MNIDSKLKSFDILEQIEIGDVVEIESNITITATINRSSTALIAPVTRALIGSPAAHLLACGLLDALEKVAADFHDQLQLVKLRCIMTLSKPMLLLKPIDQFGAPDLQRKSTIQLL